MNIKITQLNTPTPRTYDISWLKFNGGNMMSSGFIWSSDVKGDPAQGLYHLQSNDCVLDLHIMINDNTGEDNSMCFTCVNPSKI